MEESIDTFKVMYTPENMAFLENLFGHFTVLKLLCRNAPPVLVVGFTNGKLLRGAKVPLRPGMHINSIEEVKLYLLESMLEK